MLKLFWPFNFWTRFISISHSQTNNSQMAEPIGHDDIYVEDKESSESEGETISKRLSRLQDELLIPLKEDISDWINKTLGEVDISVDNFIQALDTGIILCRLSMIIEQKAQECLDQGLLKEPLPLYKLHCDEKASPGTWYARDNTANFLKWCRAYGMADDTLFDTEDLVTHHHERQIIYCLMELARIGARYGLEPPSLITMEKEIDSEVVLPSPLSIDGIPLISAKKDRPTTLYNDIPCPLEPPGRQAIPSSVSRLATVDNESCTLSGKDTILVQRFLKQEHSNVQNGDRFEFTEDGKFEKLLYFLSKNVYKVSLKCDCEDQVRKLSEGVFNVYGKQVFIRLLKGKHLMVRVGGGWDTFENYLLHHVPVQVFRFSHGSQNEPVQSSASSESNSNKLEYLVIRSKYKSSSFHSGNK